jgi:hypothetical protein
MHMCTKLKKKNSSVYLRNTSMVDSKINFACIKWLMNSLAKYMQISYDDLL